uniref:Uncharacterized protein n=1 Tax=Arundo donax TaxID=35708 RepID=A0A0A9F9P6_ARUDO
MMLTHEIICFAHCRLQEED